MQKTSQTKHATLFSDMDIHLFRSGKHFRIYERLGSHPMEYEGEKGTYFAVWAPNGRELSVIGDFNGWTPGVHPLFPRWDNSGIWEGFIPDIGHGTVYKYHMYAPTGRPLEKGDPYARRWEIPPDTASIVWHLDYEWKDKAWLKTRKKKADESQPYSVYEVHLGSWKKYAIDRSLSYLEMADELVKYVKSMGFTHIEMMPVMEHPYSPSWGYQITGYFAPSSRFGTPEEFMALVDACHTAEIGVLLDWVPSHFPADAHGLADFDGTHLYDHEDPRKGFHPDWKSCIFNYGRNEVRSFLISNALFWLDLYHADGLRVDAVASMLYLDYSRDEGQWIPNIHGGNENLEAISFMKEFNETVYAEYPDVVTIAEESTSWTGVSRPTYTGGLGFGQKWMMGWMHDTLNYFKRNPIYRMFHQNELTFSMVYAYSESFMLPLSHDEVVHGKGSLLSRMPGDEWQRFANLRLLYAYMFTHPGTKLLFMGGEFAQTSEWNFEWGLNWELLSRPLHKGMQLLIQELNLLYQHKKALFQFQFSQEGFEWIDYSDHKNSVLIYLRKGDAKTKPLVIVCNLTPVVRSPYQVGVPQSGQWVEIFNSDETKYGGSGQLNEGKLKAVKAQWHHRDHHLSIKLAPLAVMVLEPVRLKKVKSPKLPQAKS
ncbi:MAG: 1,4-alpha-glucan branching protein GlgB [Bacteroidota bacterium]